jgi:hypothetical protein
VIRHATLRPTTDHTGGLVGEPVGMSCGTCEHCGERIGTYEPIVQVDARGERTTSLAAEPGLTRCLYHLDCWVSLGRSAQALACERCAA